MQLPPIPAKLPKSEFWENAYFLAYATAFSLLYGLVTSIFSSEKDIFPFYAFLEKTVTDTTGFMKKEPRQRWDDMGEK